MSTKTKTKTKTAPRPRPSITAIARWLQDITHEALDPNTDDEHLPHQPHLTIDPTGAVTDNDMTLFPTTIHHQWDTIIPHTRGGMYHADLERAKVFAAFTTNDCWTQH